MKSTDMTTCSAKLKTVRPITDKDEQIFIDRLLEILLMQVETDENKNNYKNENYRIRETI